MTLREWYDRMGEEERDLNNNMLQLFQIVGVTDGADVKLIETSHHKCEDPEDHTWPDIDECLLPEEGGWICIADGDDAQCAVLYLDKKCRARWGFASQGSWYAEGWVDGKKYVSYQREPEWKEVVHVS